MSEALHVRHYAECDCTACREGQHEHPCRYCTCDMAEAIDAAIEQGKKEGRREGLEKAIKEVRTGRTVNNFAHVSTMMRALEWVISDLYRVLDKESKWATFMNH
jgi:flagellar biosynthesis/type III secretory pathway protein FliH